MQTTANKSAQAFIDEGLAKLDSLNFTKKLYQHDGALWKADAESIKFINGFLGWTEVYDWTLKQLPAVKQFADEVRPLFNHVVLMGMGGSSLAPEVLRVIFGPQKDRPQLLVLDSTNPDWVARVRGQIDPAKTLFIFASKSGGTVEPASQFAYFYDEVSKVSQNPGANFVAITDPGTGLEELAKQKNFRKIFLNPADIGGRFSALSLFGAVPAVLCGLNFEEVLKRAQKEGKNFKSDRSSAAAKLGAFMGAAHEAGRDKVTLLMPSNIDSLGLWIEQLVAESTGKEGKGILPVAGERPRRDLQYKDDRIFVHISCPGADNFIVQQAADAISKAGLPLLCFEIEGPLDIGVQFLLWEVATAAAGAILQINPFDQPNVQAAKTITKNLLADLEGGKKSPDTAAPFLASGNLKNLVKPETMMQDLYRIINPHDYIALLAYLDESAELNRIIDALREKIFMRFGNAVVFGYGPRYLHSTGQLHKGDGNKGLFIIITAQGREDVKIPGQKYTFGDLCAAQALADFKALEEKGRRAVKLHFTKPAQNELAYLTQKI